MPAPTTIFCGALGGISRASSHATSARALVDAAAKSVGYRRAPATSAARCRPPRGASRCRPGTGALAPIFPRARRRRRPSHARAPVPARLLRPRPSPAHHAPDPPPPSRDAIARVVTSNALKVSDRWSSIVGCVHASPPPRRRARRRDRPAKPDLVPRVRPTRDGRAALENPPRESSRRFLPPPPDSSRVPPSAHTPPHSLRPQERSLQVRRGRGPFGDGEDVGGSSAARG